MNLNNLGIVLTIIGSLAILGQFFVKRHKNEDQKLIFEIVLLIGALLVLWFNYFYQQHRQSELNKNIISLSEDKWRRAAHFTPVGSLGKLCYGNDPICYEVLKTFNKSGNEFFCNIENYNIWLKAIQIEPTFPFAYYYLAYCYKVTGNSDWQKYSENAKIILNETMKFSHDENQDFLLKQVNAL